MEKNVLEIFAHPDDAEIICAGTLNKTTALIRKIRPGLVFTASPIDFMVDHEITSLIVQTAWFSAGIKNLEVEEESFEPIPFLYYCDPIEGKNKICLEN